MARMRFVSVLSVFMVFSLPCFAAEERDYFEAINGTRLHFRVSTVDPAQPYILYLNGGPGDTPVFERAILQLVNLNLNMIYLDQRSCGKSERKVDPTTFTEENLVKDIDGVLDHLGLKKIVLLGHSFGATYGTAYATHRPDRVLALFYMDGPVDFMSTPRNFYRFYSPEETEESEVMADGLSTSGFWDNNSVLMGRITALKPEFHYFVGKYDRMFFSPELSDWVRQKYGASHVTVFEKSGHSPIFEEPEAFKEAITRAYRNLKAAP